MKPCLRDGERQEVAGKRFQPAEASASGRVRGLSGEEWVDIEGEKKGLVIDSSTVGMESARSYRKASATMRRFVITDYQDEPAQGKNALNAAVSGNAQNSVTTEDKEGEKAEQNGNTLQDWQARFQAANTKVNIRSSASRAAENFRQTTIRYIFDLLFSSRRNRLNRWMEEKGIQTYDSGSSQFSQSSWMTYSAGSLKANSESAFLTMQPGNLAVSMRVLNYSQETFRIETEDTAFSTVGTVRTADGREIDFNVNVGMSRQFQQTFREDLELASFTMCDPLVINLDTDVASLSDQTFYFDIDADGELDEVSRLGAGSGYLALDKNGDGVINDGSELFGTASGNGFADLAKYDEDGNGWIDENDAIWNKLKIWAKDENGNDVLYRLADKGVGAICLQNVSTDFTLTGQSGQTNGAIRNSGIFLYENGNAGTVQHVDVAKYDKGA